MTSPPPLPPPLTDEATPLHRLVELAIQLGDARAEREASDLAARLVEGRFYVACIGQFKRGKSTLLDALAGDRLLPVGVVPVTAVPTVIRYGRERRARIRLRSGNWQEIPLAAIPDFVSQERNPDNAKEVEGVEIFTPSPLLASGMCLVDTPGLGSVFAANTGAAHAFVPHIDAALVVFGADPPLSGAELDLVAEIAAQVPDLIFILNKADRADESDRAAAAGFSRGVIERRLGRPIGPIYQVSALAQVEGRPPSPAQGANDWPTLITALEELSAHSGRRLRFAAAARGTRRLAAQLLHAVAEEAGALRRPLRDSQARIEDLRRLIASAERSLADLGALLATEQMRLSRHFAQRRKDFLPRCRGLALTDLQAALRALPRLAGPAYRRAAMHTAQDVSHRHLLPWLATEQLEAEREFRRTTLRFLELARDFLRRSAAAGLPAASLEEEPLAPSNFYFCDFIGRAEPASPLRFLADVCLGGVGSYGPIQADAVRFLDLLLGTNAARVESDLNQRAGESRRHLEADIRSRLREVVAVSERALSRAAELHSRGDAATAAALGHLATLEHELTTLCPLTPHP